MSQPDHKHGRGASYPILLAFGWVFALTCWVNFATLQPATTMAVTAGSTASDPVAACEAAGRLNLTRIGGGYSSVTCRLEGEVLVATVRFVRFVSRWEATARLPVRP